MYTLRVKLDLCESEERFLSKCFFFCNRIHNTLVKCAQERLDALYHDKDYQDAKMEYGASGLSSKKKKLSKEQKKRKQELANLMNAKIEEYHLLKTDFEQYIKTMQHNHKNYISSQQAQAEVNAVYSGVKKVLYGDGERLRFKRYNEFDCIKQKSSSNGVIIRDWSKIKFMGHFYKLVLPEDTPYMNEMVNRVILSVDVVYTSLKRIEFDSGYHYYAIITLRGEAPKKLKKCDHTNVVGVDFGTSTIATASEDGLNLTQLAPLSNVYDKQIRHLQKQIERSMRLHNPDNYNADGIAKRGKHHWVVTKRCKRLKRKLRVLYRKQTAYIQTSHRTFLNRLIQTTSEFILEPMQFKKLQCRSKKTERSEKLSAVKTKDGTVKQVHKYKRKKRYGHSIKNRSPGFMQAELKRKAEQYDIPYHEIDVSQYRASQFHHDTGEYIKPDLSERFKTIDGHEVQRDLYSAFLICNTSNTLTTPDGDKCKTNFPHFVELHDTLISNMKQQGISMKQCFGF